MSELRLLVGCVAERDFHALVVSLAKRLGWRVAHTARAQVRGGRWLTPTVAGLPDLILCRPPRLIFAELKSEQGRVRPEQQAWMDALAQCAGVEVYLWRPSDWQAIVETLTQGER